MRRVGQTPASWRGTLGFRATPRPRLGAAVRARCPRSTWPTWPTCRRTTASAGLRSCISRRRGPRPSRAYPTTETIRSSTSRGQATCVASPFRRPRAALPHRWRRKPPYPAPSPGSCPPLVRPHPGLCARHLSSERELLLAYRCQRGEGRHDLLKGVTAEVPVKSGGQLVQ